MTNIIDQENERLRKEAEKEENWKLWTLFLHSSSGESYNDWKKRILKTGAPKRSTDENLTDAGIKAIIDSLFPPK